MSFTLTSSDKYQLLVDESIVKQSDIIAAALKNPETLESKSKQFMIDVDMDTLQTFTELLPLSQEQLLNKLKHDQRQLSDLFSLLEVARRYHFNTLILHLEQAVVKFISDPQYQTKEGSKFYQQITKDLKKGIYLLYNDYEWKDEYLVGIFRSHDDATNYLKNEHRLKRMNELKVREPSLTQKELDEYGDFIVKQYAVKFLDDINPDQDIYVLQHNGHNDKPDLENIDVMHYTANKKIFTNNYDDFKFWFKVLFVSGNDPTEQDRLRYVIKL